MGYYLVLESIYSYVMSVVIEIIWLCCDVDTECKLGQKIKHR